MNKSQRIYLNTGTTQFDKHIKFQLQQDVDMIEFMTMNIYTKDAYQDFNADYGVLVGRVIANGGIGIPNAKVSIFIPLTDEDAESGQISSIYPYKTPRDKNAQGKRYNLLPRVSEYDPTTGTYSPKQPFGSFPIKPEIVTNQNFLDVYKKYYKYTALTNSAGDYMIFGVPVGTQTVHLSVDITDIGKYSMNPASMVTNLGYSPNLFFENNSKIKPSDDLNDLPNIETQEISVDIIPFWGDTTNFTIGITRQDFRIRAVLDNTFIIFGSAFTDGDNSMWGGDDLTGGGTDRMIRELYHINGLNSTQWVENVGIMSKRSANITEKIYYYPPEISDARIDAGNVDPVKDMLILDSSQYSIYKENGNFVFIISCNRNKVVTDDFGNEVPISYSSPNGIFTQFRGFITVEITNEDVPMNFREDIGNHATLIPYRFRLKIPQYAQPGKTFQPPNINTNADVTETNNWRKQNFRFSGGTIYGISNFHGVVLNTTDNDNNQHYDGTTGFLNNDLINQPYNAPPPNRDFRFNSGIIQTNDVLGITGNTQYEMVANGDDVTGNKFFGGNWLNLSLYLPQFGNIVNGYAYVKYMRTATNFSIQVPQTEDTGRNYYYLNDNLQPIAAGQVNTKWFARSDLHWTDFIKLTKRDILNMGATDTKGFTVLPAQLSGSTYRNGTYTPPGWAAPCPYNGGKNFMGITSANPNPNPPIGDDPKIYYYKGFDEADCIKYLISLGLV